MQTPDIINGLFEGVGIIFAVGNIRQIIKDKSVAGVYIPAVGFWSAWGYWNLYYYPGLDQIASTAAAGLLALANTVYLALLLKYRQ